jgi:hypothetical protein
MTQMLLIYLIPELSGASTNVAGSDQQEKV